MNTSNTGRWIARYGDTIQAPDKDRYNYTIWQCTDGNTESGLNSTSGLVAGIPAGNDVDVNFGYVDYTKKVTPRKDTVEICKLLADTHIM